MALLVPLAVPHVASAQSPPRVAILPFEVSGALEFVPVGSFMPDMLASRMNHLGPFRFVDTSAVRGSAGEKGFGTLSPADAGALARRFRADYLISGSIRRNEGVTAFSAQLHRGDGSPVGDRVIVPFKGADDLLPKLEPLAEALASRLKGAEAPEEAPPGPG
jgi:TolB-like protein